MLNGYPSEYALTVIDFGVNGCYPFVFWRLETYFFQITLVSVIKEKDIDGSG